MMTKFLQGLKLLWQNKRATLRILAALCLSAAFIELYLMLSDMAEKLLHVPYLALTLNSLMVGAFVMHIKPLSKLVWTFAWR